MNFRERMKKSDPIILDGAMGSLLFKKIPDYTGCFELLNIENPEVIGEVHKLYIDAGADIVETNSFGGNKIKLEEYSLGHRCREINRAAASLAKKAVGERGYVGGSVGPTGTLIEPIGNTTVDEVYDAFKEQMIGLEEGGADLIVIETMSDIQEAKLALLAAKHHTNLPVICNMTFENNGKTISGTDIVTAFATLSQSGADYVGANCGLGPDGLLEIYKNNIDNLKALGTPMTVWSNAGLPVIRDGETVYPLEPEKFGKLSAEFARLGVKVIGGCCGTTPEHISALKEEISKTDIPEINFEKKYDFITGRYATVDLQKKDDLLKIGERLNPTARKKFAAELKEGKTDFLRVESKAQQEEGADLLDINVGVPEIDEISAMRNCIKILSNDIRIPLMIDSDNPEVLEAALRLYPGVSILNSINGKEKSIKNILPLVKKYGCFVVVLCLDESGIHHESEKRIQIGESIIEKLEAEGINSGRVIVDPLMLAESAEPGSAVETLKVIEHFSKKNIKTSLGISNVSFGLPQRKFINNTYLKLAMDRGLTAGIINTKSLRIIDEFSEEEKLACDFLLGKDKDALKYIEYFASNTASPVTTGVKKSEEIKKHILDIIFDQVVKGNSDGINSSVEEALKENSPEDIMDKALLKGLEKVGDLYSKGDYFLPQMISSANTMQSAFKQLKPLLAQKSNESQGKIVICTVKGDIHDIGKNIVSMMLENHGFEIYDMGKDVPNEDIIEKAKEVKADIICLSSLLTTTMPEMKAIREIIKEKSLPFKVMVGGAVVTEEYANNIEAHYSEDAVGAVNLAKSLLKK